MPPTRRQRLSRLSRLALVAALATAGCTGQPEVMPSGDRASAALTAALEAWKAGRPCGEVPEQSPRVIAVDSSWQAGNRLQSYELVGPVADSQPPRYRVKLTTVAPRPAIEEITYVLVGTDPVYVYRESDFDRMINMDNNPGSARGSK